MKRIKDLVDTIDEELCGAKMYAEKYVEYKAKGDMQQAGKFKEMSNDELRHAAVIHDLAVKEIEELNKVFTTPQKMQDKWDKSHIHYVEKEAWIKQMLAM